MMNKLLQRSSSYIKTLVKSDKKKLERKYKSNIELKSAYSYNINNNSTVGNSGIINNSKMEYKSGILYKLSTGIFKNRKKYWFILTRTHFLYYSSPDKLSNPLESILLTEIKNIILLQKENESIATTYGFIIEHSNKQLILQSDSLSSIADWVIKLDGIIHPNFKSFLNQVDRKQLLKIMYKDNIKGGIIKSSDTEEWNYSSIGKLFIDDISLVDSSGNGSDSNNDNNEKIDYHWDGEWLKSSTHNSILGYGRFNGVYLAWFLKDNTFPEIRYFYDEKEKEYISDRKEFTFKWTRHFLASKYGSGEWIVEGHVPQPVVMFLQLIKYKRNSLKNNGSGSNNGQLNPFSCDIPLPSSPSSSPSSSSPPSSSSSHGGAGCSTTDASTTTSSPITTMTSNINTPIQSSSSSTASSSIETSSSSTVKPTTSSTAPVKPVSKVTPFTKGNALLNVSHGLFNSRDGHDEDENNNQKQQEISNFSTSSDDLSLSTSITSFTSHQHNISNLSDNSEIFNIINNHKKSQQQQQQQQSGMTSAISSDEISSSTNSSGNNTVVNLTSQFESHNNTNNTTTTTRNINHSRKSTIQLLNDTIDESEKIKTRKSYIDQNSLQQIINDFNKEAELQQPILINKQQQQQHNNNNDDKVTVVIIPPSPPIAYTTAQQTTQSPPHNLANISNSTSTSTESLVISKFTTPLGSIIGPALLNNVNSNNNNPSNSKIIVSPSSTETTVSPSISTLTQQLQAQSQAQQQTDVNNNQSTIGNHRKPLAKSKSSEKVTTIINQISATKSNRSTFCIYCNLPITGPMIVAQGNHSHQECHKCFKCKIELGTKTFYRQQVDNYLYSSSNSLNNSSHNHHHHHHHNSHHHNGNGHNGNGYNGGSSSYNGGSLGYSNSLNNFVTLSSSPSSSPSKFTSLLNSSNSTSTTPYLSQSPPQSSSIHLTVSGTTSTSNSNNINSNSNTLSNSPSLSTIANNHHKSGPRYLCQSCFDECSNICPRCKNLVQYRCVNIQGKKWHPDCCSGFDIDKFMNNNNNNITTEVQ